MPDQLDTLFADLRAETLTRTRPPGVTAVRRTVRRRRCRKVAGATLALAAVAGGGYAYQVLPGRSTAPADTPAGREAVAIEAVRLGRPQHPTLLSGSGTVTGGVIARGQLLAGTYQVRLACSGPGRITVVLRTGQDVAEHLGPPCERAPLALAAEFVVPAGGPASLELRPDSAARGRAGYAYLLTLSDADMQRLARQATARLPRIGRVYNTSWSPLVTSVSGGDDDMPAGRYRIRSACVGTGTMTVTATVRRAGTAVADTSGTADCGPGGTYATMTLELAPGDTLEHRMLPDANALGQAYGVMDVERV